MAGTFSNLDAGLLPDGISESVQDFPSGSLIPISSLEPFLIVDELPEVDEFVGE